MNANLSYLNTEYAREKMIESYDLEAKEREEKELAAGMAAFALKTITEINERYIKINGVAKMTGKEIVDKWHEQASTAWFKTDMDDLKKIIDAALQLARAEGQIASWEQAKKLAEVMLGKNNQSTTRVCICQGYGTTDGKCALCGLPKATPTY